MPRLTTARVRAERAAKQFRERERLRETTLFAVLGNNAGTVETTTVGVVWIRLHGDPNQVTRALASSSVPCRDEDADTTVKVEKLKQFAGARYRIVGLASEVYPADPRGGLVAPHGWEHEYDDFNTGGSDPVNVHADAIIPLRAQPQTAPDMTVYVNPGSYQRPDGSDGLWAGGNSPAFVVPTPIPFLTVRRCDLLYLASDGATLTILQGTQTTDGSEPARPATPANCTPICWAYLDSAMTTISSFAYLLSARQLVSSVLSATMPATPHAILSATHSDTAAAAVVDGDTIIGNVTPAWSRLPISVPAANVRNVLGVDNTELRPSWKTALDATNPTTIGVSDVAAAGTSLVFSHRDHQHGSPATFPPDAHTIGSHSDYPPDAAGVWTNDGAGNFSWGAGGEAHDILSATHTDTLADAVIDGDVLIGNVTPKWSRLAISVPAANVRNVLGIDNGELRPSWKTALDATNPATLTVSASAAPGTSLVFSHRDHVHPITSSANPGAAASLLASNASGYLQLVALGLGIAAVSSDPLILAKSNANTDTAFGSQNGIVIKNTNGTNNNYTTIFNLNSAGAVNSGIVFQNVNHTYAGKIIFNTRSLVGEYGNRMSINEVGNVLITPGVLGIGSIRTVALLNITGGTGKTEGMYITPTFVVGASQEYGLYIDSRFNPGVGSFAGTKTSVFFQSRISSGTHTGTIASGTNPIGLNGAAISDGTGAGTNFIGIEGRVTNNGSGNITNAYGLYGLLAILSTGNITTGYSIYVQNPIDTGAGAFTNCYGLYLENITTGGTLNYALYSNGGQSYHAGNLGLGAAIVPATLLHVLLEDATTNAVVNVFTLGKNVTGAGVGANNLGVAQVFQMETSTTIDTIAARIYAQAYNATHASRQFDLVLTAYDTAEREIMRGRGSGTAPMLGFYGGTPVIRGAALTVADASAVNSGDATTDTVINNMRTRINELEARLGSATGVNLFA